VQRLQDALKRVTGQEWAVRLDSACGTNGQHRPAAPAAVAPPSLDNPLIRRTLEVLDAKLIQVDERFGQTALATADDTEAPMSDTEET